MLFALLACLYSCSKDQDNISPVITIINPIENSYYELGDSINIKAVIEDDRKVESVAVNITTVGYVPVTSLESFQVGQSSYELNATIWIDETFIETGEYLIRIFATDGSNDKRKYRSVRISGEERRVEGYLAITMKNISQSDIQILAPDFHQDSIFTLSRPYLLSSINDRTQQFHYITPNPSEIITFNTREFAIDWEDGANPPYAEFTGTDVNRYLYVATANGNIRGYDGSGAIVYQTGNWPEYLPEELAVSEEFVVAEQVARSGVDRYLVVYYTTSGFEKNRVLMGDDIRGIAVAGSEFLFLEWDGENGSISLLDPVEMDITRLRIVSGAKWEGIIPVNESLFLVYSEDIIYMYRTAFNELAFFTAMEGTHVILEDVDNQLFLIGDEGVRVLGFPSGIEIASLTFDDPLLGFHVIHNK